MFNLTASTDSAKPVLMSKPETIDKIHYIKYNNIDEDDDDPVWEDIKYVPIQDFFDMIHQFNPSETNIASFSHTTDGFTFTFNYYTDRGPSYCSSFNDNTIIFDAFNSDVDSTLQSSKTLCYGTKKTSFTLSDTFIPELQPQHFALLLNEAKSVAWAEIKQSANVKAEQGARRNWSHLGKTRHNIVPGAFDSSANTFNNYPNFGRK
jgi:hypothetical protein